MSLPRKTGFSIVELMIVVAIISILAAIALPSFVQYIRASKTSEALKGVRTIYDGETSYFFKEKANRGGNVLATQFLSSGPSPAGVPSGQKSIGDWSASNWNSLEFGQDGPVYYQYEAIAAGVGSSSSFTARAQGDLDADGTYSLFERIGTIDAGGDVQGSGAVYFSREFE